MKLETKWWNLAQDQWLKNSAEFLQYELRNAESRCWAWGLRHRSPVIKRPSKETPQEASTHLQSSRSGRPIPEPSWHTEMILTKKSSLFQSQMRKLQKKKTSQKKLKFKAHGKIQHKANANKSFWKCQFKKQTPWCPQRRRQAELCEVEVILVYTASSGPAQGYIVRSWCKNKVVFIGLVSIVNPGRRGRRIVQLHKNTVIYFLSVALVKH